MKFRKILIAEDDETNYQLIQQIFEKTGAELLWAKNGKEAVELYSKNQDIDLILMDIKMPIMGGEMAATKIKEINPDVPIIGVSSYDKYALDISSGLDAYVQKPFLPNQLVSVIEGHMENLVGELLKREEDRVKQLVDNEKEALEVLSGVAELLELTDYVNKTESIKVMIKLDEIKDILNKKGESS